jgi:hypothetical protein
MKPLLFCLFIAFCFQAFGEEDGLPFESDLTRVTLPKVGIGHRLELNYALKIPDTQKLNHGAPSNVTVFEKAKGEKTWTATKEINLNEKSFVGSGIKFREVIDLKSDDSEIAVHSTVYHCGRKDTKVPCYIQGFQGFPKRVKNAKSNNVHFNVVGKVD